MSCLSMASLIRMDSTGAGQRGSRTMLRSSSRMGCAALPSMQRRSARSSSLTAEARQRACSTGSQTTCGHATAAPAAQRARASPILAARVSTRASATNARCCRYVRDLPSLSRALSLSHDSRMRLLLHSAFRDGCFRCNIVQPIDAVHVQCESSGAIECANTIGVVCMPTQGKDYTYTIMRALSTATATVPQS